jgi:hypothetical protein
MRPDASEIRRRHDGSIDTDSYVRRAVVMRKAHIGLVFSTIRLIFARCYERMAERREVARMSARDMRDLAIPSDIVKDECHRWPWQSMSDGWDVLAATRSDLVAAASRKRDRAHRGE